MSGFLNYPLYDDLPFHVKEMVDIILDNYVFRVCHARDHAENIELLECVLDTYLSRSKRYTRICGSAWFTTCFQCGRWMHWDERQSHARLCKIAVGSDFFAPVKWFSCVYKSRGVYKTRSATLECFPTDKHTHPMRKIPAGAEVRSMICSECRGHMGGSGMPHWRCDICGIGRSGQYNLCYYCWNGLPSQEIPVSMEEEFGWEEWGISDSESWSSEDSE